MEIHFSSLAHQYLSLVSSLSDPLSEPVQASVTTAMASLLPEDLALETYNSQYLQRHSQSADAVLAAARVSSKLKAPISEVEDSVFGMLRIETECDVKVSQTLFALLVHKTDYFGYPCRPRSRVCNSSRTSDQRAQRSFEQRATSASTCRLHLRRRKNSRACVLKLRRTAPTKNRQRLMESLRSRRFKWMYLSLYHLFSPAFPKVSMMYNCRPGLCNGT